LGRERERERGRSPDTACMRGSTVHNSKIYKPTPNLG
jgi:hypothetical protein